LSKKILITGASGQLGSYLCKVFLNRYNVLGTARKEGGNSYKLDISDGKQVKAVLHQENPDIIINCASYNNVDQSESHKIKARETIVQGISNIVRFSSKNTMIVHISSDYIFSGDKELYHESDKPHPINYYGKLKLESENILIGSNRKYAIIRPNVVFSGDIKNKSNFLGWVVRNLDSNKKINVVSDQVSNPTPVELLGEVIESIILLNIEGIFNVGTSDPISRYEFALKIAKIFNYDTNLINEIKTDDLKQLALRPKRTYLSCNKISNELELDVYSVDHYLKNYSEVIFE